MIIAQRAVFACTLAAIVIPTSRADDWPSWRGPLNSNISPEKAVPPAWSATQNILWKAPLPDRGISSPVIWGDKVFLTQAIEKENRRTLMCFNRATGQLLWQSGVTYEQRDPTNRHNPHCAASPVTDGQRVYAFFGSPGLFCYDLAGKELWRRDLGKVDNWHGSGSSPILHGDLVILNFGPGSNSALVACNKLTGDIAWKVPSPRPALFGSREPSPPFAQRAATAKPAEPAPASTPSSRPAQDLSGAGYGADFTGGGGFLGSWSTPLIARIRDSGRDRDHLIVPHATQLTSYDPLTGKELWTIKGLSKQVVSSPAFANDTLIITSNLMNGGCAVLAINLSATAPLLAGDITQSHVLWHVRLRRQCVGSPIIHDGHAFFVSDSAFATCLDLKTGSIQWEQRLAGASPRSGSWSTPLLVNGKLLIVNQSAETFVLDASPTFKLHATHALPPETTCATPALSNGQLFIRTHQSLYCIAPP